MYCFGKLRGVLANLSFQNHDPQAMKLTLLFFPIFFAGATYSQDTLSGVVNSYAAIDELVFCEGKLIVGPSVGTFGPGQKVLLLQMKGAQIDESNSASFGTITELNDAGHFELNEVKAISADTIWLRYTLQHHYDTEGAVQLVGLPEAPATLYLQDVSCLPWNGAYGGVLAVQNSGSITLLSHLSANGMGFGNEQAHEVESNCTWLTFALAYYYPSSNWRGAPKGEGIASFISEKEHGRGPQANGGGGGNDHNSGGGGGSNAGAGGQGGQQTPASAFGCSGNFPGMGGKALPLSPTRLFMGGEGGNGHVDDPDAGSPGAKGGGIILLITDTLITNGFGLSANGNTPPTATGDGAGGGGGGGSIYLSAAVILGNTTLSTVGGHGGDVINPADRCFGAGGGGGGGRIAAPMLANVSAIVAGGEAGQNSTPSSQCSDLSNGAQPGSTGTVEAPFALPKGEEEYLPTTVLAQPVSLNLCEGDTAVFQFLVQGNFLHYQWQAKINGIWQNLPNDTNQTLTLLPGSFDQALIRCVVSSPCMAPLTSEEVSLHTQSVPVAAFDVVAAGDGNFEFQNNSTNAVNYHWQFGDGNTSDEANPLHHYQNQGSYSVLLIAENICGSDTALEVINYVPAPVADFSISPAEGCAPLTVFFENNSQGNNIETTWSFPGGTPAGSTDDNPVVVYAEAGNYDVQLIVQNSFGTDTLLKPNAVLVHPLPVADFSFLADGLSVQFQYTGLGASSFFWEFGDGTISTEENPVHTYPEPGTYEVGLTVSNGPCGASVAKTMALIANSSSENPWAHLQLYPNPTAGTLHLSFGQHPSDVSVEVAVFDSLGNLLFENTITAQEGILELGELPAGFCLLVLKMEGQRIHLPVLIVR